MSALRCNKCWATGQQLVRDVTVALPVSDLGLQLEDVIDDDDSSFGVDGDVDGLLGS